MTDDAESRSPHGVRRQSEIDNVENVEEFRAKFQNAQLAFAAMAERCVFDQRHIEIAKAGAAKCVAAQGSESPRVRTRASSNVDGYREKRAVVSN